MGKLTKKEIERANKRRKYSDGRGLFLSVGKGGSKTWAFCYRFPDASRNTLASDGSLKPGYREREMSLGPLHGLNLDEARDKAVELRRLVREGIDPMEDRDRQVRNVVRQRRVGSTFEEIATRFIDMKKAEWDKGGASEQSWRGSLAKHAFPAIGHMPVDRIDRADVLDLLTPIWTKTTVTATRLLPRIEQIFDYAIAEGLRSAPNPADRHNIRKSLPSPSKIHVPKHHRALPYQDLPAFMAELRRRQANNPNAISPKVLEFTILTAMRRREAALATWDEFDLKDRMWTIPASRMKIKREGSGEEREAHRVPLSDAAISLLNGLVREDGNPHLFIAMSERKSGGHIDLESARKYLVDDMGYAGKATLHGFRTSFKNWAMAATNYPHEISELAIAHYPTDKTVSAYFRTDLFEKRVPLMADWAAYIGGEEP
jgi:integrase